MNRIKLISSLFLLGITINVFAQSDNESLFSKAQSEYAMGYYAKARNLCSKILASGDIKYTAKCQALLSDIVKIENEHQKQLSNYISVPSLICLPYGTGSQDIKVNASGSWDAHSNGEWIKTKINNKILTITAVEQNLTTKKKTSSVIVECGEISRTITVEQDAAPEILEYKSKYLKVPYEGGQFIVDIKTNTEWKVEYADWYKAFPFKNDSTRMVINIDKNTKNDDRIGTVVVRSESGETYDQLEIYQYPNESVIFAAVDSIIEVGCLHDTLFVPVISDNPSWTVSDRASWLYEQKINQDTLMIIVAENDNYFSREGFANIKSGDRVSGIWVKQAGKVMPSFLTANVVEGRNVSLCFSASYYLPFVVSSSGGEYVGSVVDYGLGTSAENATYKSATGFNFGLSADIRLYKNIFLNTGLFFTRIIYNNEFDKNTTLTIPQNNYEYLKGSVQNSYSENYSHSMLELPILASYCFKINPVSLFRINVGPVLNFGLTAKLSLAGNTDSETIKMYSNTTHQQINNNNYLRHTAVNASFDLYQPFILWNEVYTTGNDAVFYHKDKFQDSPLNRVNCGLRFGIAYEYAGVSLGISYMQMLTNMANKNYWENERWTVLNNSNMNMTNYFFRINAIEFKLAYTFRYLRTNK